MPKSSALTPVISGLASAANTASRQAPSRLAGKERILVMDHRRVLKVFFVVFALALCGGAANAQITASSPIALTYTPGGANTTSGTSSVSNATNANDTYVAAAAVYGSGGTGWLNAPASANTFTLPDTLTISLNAGVVATLPAGSYSATIGLTDTDATTATLTVHLTVTGSLSANAAGSTSLTWVLGGAANQPASQTTVTVSNTDSSADTFTIVKTNCPVWLKVTGSPVVNPPLQASSSAAETLTLQIDSTQLSGVVGGTSVTNCSVALDYNGVAFSTVNFTKLLVSSQPLLLTAPTSNLVYNKGTSTANPSATSVTVTVASGTPLFNLDIATMPAWLTVTSGLTNNAANTNSSPGDTVTFGVNTAVAAGMATGNYTANVGFFVTGFPDIKTAISFQVSNAAPGVTVVPASSPTNVSFTSSSATPAPTATLYSTDEPVPFTATCTVAHSASSYTATAGFATPCILNGLPNTTATNVVNATAFTWGVGMTATLDPVLFTATIGNTVTVTITFSNLSSAPAPVVYVYTIQPGLPTATGTMPSSISANFSKTSAAVVVIKGTNFIGTDAIAGSSVVQTQVWIGNTQLTNLNAGTVGSYVVADANHLIVTLAAGTLPTVAAGKTGSVIIGVANQVGPLAPTATQATATLNVTFNPVIYGITSTASFTQPSTVGASPSFAPYELISLFGDNLGLTGSASASASFDSYGKIVSPLTVVAAVGTTKAVTLLVTFKDVATGKISFTAPALFSNASQINAIVPGGVAGDQNVTVTAAGLTSDNFLVHVVPADPGIFTLLSDGTGGGAIVNQDGSINGSSHKAKAGDIVQIYMTGLGVPDSSATDVAPSIATSFPNTCVGISGTANAPGLLQWVNKAATGYTPPAWTNIDGAVMNYGAHDIILGSGSDLNLPPCMATAAITVTFGPAGNQVVSSGQGTGIQYAGFVSGAIEGLYQINVKIPASLTPSGGSLLTGATAVTLNITPTGGSTYSSQAGVTIYFQ